GDHVAAPGVKVRRPLQRADGGDHTVKVQVNVKKTPADQYFSIFDAHNMLLSGPPGPAGVPARDPPTFSKQLVKNFCEGSLHFAEEYGFDKPVLMFGRTPELKIPLIFSDLQII